MEMTVNVNHPNRKILKAGIAQSPYLSYNEADAYQVILHAEPLPHGLMAIYLHIL